MAQAVFTGDPYFNTSHVSINRRTCFCRQTGTDISIHLMFLLIDIVNAVIKIGSIISIHLMFLLIRTKIKSIWEYGDFNTSHVSINLSYASY